MACSIYGRRDGADHDRAPRLSAPLRRALASAARSISTILSLIRGATVTCAGVTCRAHSLQHHTFSVRCGLNGPKCAWRQLIESRDMPEDNIRVANAAVFGPRL